jgi:hypothetical protein
VAVRSACQHRWIERLERGVVKNSENVRSALRNMDPFVSDRYRQLLNDLPSGEHFFWRLIYDFDPAAFRNPCYMWALTEKAFAPLRDVFDTPLALWPEIPPRLTSLARYIVGTKMRTLYDVENAAELFVQWETPENQGHLDTVAEGLDDSFVVPCSLHVSRLFNCLTREKYLEITRPPRYIQMLSIANDIADESGWAALKLGHESGVLALFLAKTNGDDPIRVEHHLKKLLPGLVVVSRINDTVDLRSYGAPIRDADGGSGR